MRRVIGIDIHSTFGEVVIWENGLTRHAGRVELTRTALEGFGRQLQETDEVVIEATGNCMAVSRVLSPHVKRVVIANPLQVKAIAHAHVKTDKVDAGTLASLYVAAYLPEIWTPDAATERMRRLVARRYQVVRHRTRIKNEVHAILHAHLVPKCPHADLFNTRGRDWLARQPVPDDERAAIARHIRELDRRAEDLAALDRDIAEDALDDEPIRQLLTITGVNLTVAAGLMAAIGSIDRFASPQKLVSYFGLNPRVHQSGLGTAHHGRISKAGRSHARAMLVDGLGRGKGPRPATRLLHPHPGTSRPSDRRRRSGAQAGHAVLAYADEGRRLPLGPPQPGCPQAPRHGTGRRAAAEERQQARRELCLQREETASAGGADRRACRKEIRALRCGMEITASGKSRQVCGRLTSTGTPWAAR
ncbi:IS110 family transposase [Pararhodobacter sp. SW119]|uniref:IS110 family transposase n=1 Tax=Pararhodobacter sp. SW119 TaxID=2780075 RepID=UPI001ADF8E25|nr:IS110 family transposase [Pararhodobacter sp. SW119]